MSPYEKACLFFSAKLRKRNLALSSYVHLCPFVSSNGIATSRHLRCKVTKSKFGTVQICPNLSIYVQLRHSKPLHLRCKVTKRKFGNVQICPILSIKFLSNSTFPLNCLVFVLFYIDISS